MRFDFGQRFGFIMTPARWVGLLSILWIIFICLLHFHNVAAVSSVQVVRMGYMPVISNLAAPILDHVSRKSKEIRFETIKFSSFAEMAEALRNNNIDAAFMIAPLSIVLRQQKEDIKVIYIGNRHESTLVARKELNAAKIEDLIGKTIAVPMRYSGHNIGLNLLLEQHLLQGKINIVEMNPPDMASALAAGSLDAYFVGEPFAAQTLKSGDSRRILYVEELWDKFICNLTIVKKEFIQRNPEAVRLLVQGAARSGVWASKNPKAAANIASMYWNQPQELVHYALTTPEKRIIYDQFIPLDTELQYLADLMTRYGLLESNNIDGLVDGQFAAAANTRNVTDLKSILEPHPIDLSSR
ncbi:MAG: ABC transporter substrate-binding protein [Desulfobacteraceae bacterium]|nr:ABC transporter substrate-binding protein [Desulfobacteraceae bacterium]